MKTTFGVFIDADNVSSEHAHALMTNLQAAGNIAFVKGYGNMKSKTKGWKEFHNEYGVNATHRYNLSSNKNAADISLTVDATASLYGAEKYNTMVVVSSDCDFQPLIAHAKALGKQVVGCGYKQTPHNYVTQCQSFIYIDDNKLTLAH